MLAADLTDLKYWFSSDPVISPVSDDSQMTVVNRPVEGATEAQQPTKLFDSDLLERTRTQWKNVDWNSLVRLKVKSIFDHPDRGEISLIVACAWLQKGDSTKARLYLRYARAWGCDKALMTQMLIRGLHNTLENVAAVAGDIARMKLHLRHAITVSNHQIEHHTIDPCNIAQKKIRLTQLDWSTAQKSLPKSNTKESCITYPPNGITSYAQNFEDVMLWRALWNVPNGFYIDVGAFDPVIDSVSKAFYQNGWRGIHIEPIKEYAEKIRNDRPDEIIIDSMMGKENEEKNIYQIEGSGSGMSTGLKLYAERHLSNGWKFTEKKCKTITLAEVFQSIKNREIHWLKIDVEGMEEDVIHGWGNNTTRPWILVLEAVEPNTNSLTVQEKWRSWENLLIEKGYFFTYFDGLNRFYTHNTKKNLAKLLKIPPNVFDKFTKFSQQ